MKRRGAWWWIDRWRKSTAYTDMTLEEQGAYRNLIDELWLRDGLLPNDERILAKICGDALAWPRVREKVLARFEVTKNGLRHDTHDEVAAQTAETEDRQREKGRARAEQASRNAAGRFQPGQPEIQPDDQPQNQPSVLRTPYSVSGTDNGPTTTPPNPLAPDRLGLEREALALTRQIAERDGADPVEVFGDASEWRGSRKVNPAAIESLDRLLNTVITLRKRWRQDRPPPSAKAQQRLRRLEALATGRVSSGGERQGVDAGNGGVGGDVPGKGRIGAGDSPPRSGLPPGDSAQPHGPPVVPRRE